MTEFEKLEKMVNEFRQLQAQFLHFTNHLASARRVKDLITVSERNDRFANVEHLNQHVRLLLNHDKVKHRGKITVHRVVDGKVGPGHGNMTIDQHGKIYLGNESEVGMSFHTESDLHEIVVTLCGLVEQAEAVT